MATIDTPWQSDNLVGIQSYAFALDQGTTRGPDPKTVFLLRLVNGWYGWNQGPSPLFGRDPRGISGGRYTGQQGAFLQQVAENTYSNGASHGDTMRWESLVGVPQTSRGDGWFVAYSDSGYSRFTGGDPTTGIYKPPNGYINNFSAYHMHSSSFPLGGGVTGTWDIELQVPVMMDEVILTMKPVFESDSTNHARFNALAAGGTLGIGFNDFPYQNAANEVDLGTINTAGFDGALVSGISIDLRGASNVPGHGVGADCSFHFFYLYGITPGILMAQSEVVCNVPYILVDWLQTTAPISLATNYTYLSATEHAAPVGGKVIIPVPDMLNLPALAGSLFKVDWTVNPIVEGVIRHLIPGHTIATWTAAGRPF